MIGSWNDLANFFWWVVTGRESRPRLELSLRPSRSAFAAVIWAWASFVVLMAALVFTGNVDNPVPTWVFIVLGAIAMLWAPTQYAACADTRRLRRFGLIALAIGAPVWILPMPPDAALSVTHRFALWSLFGIATALAAPLLAFPLRLMRATPPSERPSIHD